MAVRLALLPLILLMIHIVCDEDDDDEWRVKYTPIHICALKSSTVIMRCTYTYPKKHKVMTAFWTRHPPKQGQEYPDLSVDPEYIQRLQYLGDKQQNCTVRLSHVTKKDEHVYYFRFTTNVTKGMWIGTPGVHLSVTDLQLESPERVTEGDSVRLTCKSSCKLTDTPTFIWYRNSQTLTVRSNELLLQSVRREDAGRYRCAVHGHTLTSPEVYLIVTYPPNSVSVSISGSAVIMSGDSVTLSCSSDSNPPAQISWFKGNKSLNSGGIFSISKISSDDSGEYKCKARNDHGVKYSDPVTLNVQYPPKSVSVSISGSVVIMEGDSVSLSCSSDSNPPAEISWFKGNTSLNSGRIFSISKISSDDSGEYKCKARNEHGEKYSDPVTLDVQLPKHKDSSMYAAFRIGATCAVLLLLCILLFISTRKKAGVSNNRQNQVRRLNYNSTSMDHATL
ncbi:B-cell receptor CD22-like [Danio aesculapii]|uniref:B-cell receptor CD22-like n=1 Tax=Danio aesculapii TaxID=1142201 RepID=UPI0024C030F9|nr:B-cell receptor CD22-like [Danio aesculapii]